MRASFWNNLLTLMTFIILADDKVYQEEVETFTRRAMELNSIVSPEIMFTRKMAMDWFLAHRDECRAVIKGPDFRLRVMQLLYALKEYPDLRPVHKALVDIAEADGDFHSSEMKITDLAAKEWKLL